MTSLLHKVSFASPDDDANVVVSAQQVQNRQNDCVQPNWRAQDEPQHPDHGEVEQDVAVHCSAIPTKYYHSEHKELRRTITGTNPSVKINEMNENITKISYCQLVVCPLIDRAI